MILNVYINDDGDFLEVMCVCISEFNVKIDVLNIEIDK